MNSIIKKLGIDKFEKLLILNSPDEFKSIIKEIKSDVNTEIIDTYPYILCFEKDKEKLDMIIPALISALEKNGQFWVAYPKGTSKLYKSNLNRDIIRNLFQQYKFDGVAIVAIDDNWSAMRVRSEELIKSGKK
jgi:hypothetical protein